ncbi:MAG: GNAT family protein [Burkholderiaceae bacterium]
MNATLEPLMVDLPAEIDTGRFVLRAPRPGDGALLNAAVCASIESLRPWMFWAQKTPTPEESELECRRMAARFAKREDLPLFIVEPGAGGAERIVGASGLHRIDWSVPRFEIGYWRRSGDVRRGIVAEAVARLTRLAFDQLRATRVEIRMAATNAASRRVAERAGYTFEGLLRRDVLGVDGQPRDTLIYSRVRGVEEAA